MKCRTICRGKSVVQRKVVSTNNVSKPVPNQEGIGESHFMCTECPACCEVLRYCQLINVWTRSKVRHIGTVTLDFSVGFLETTLHEFLAGTIARWT